MNSTSAKVSLCVAFAILASSCSYASMQRMEEMEKNKPDCVSSRLAPVIDSVVAAGSSIPTIGFTAIAIDRGIPETTSPVSSLSVVIGTSLFAAGSAVFGAFWTSSAVQGFRRAKVCEELKKNYVDERRAAHPAPRANP